MHANLNAKGALACPLFMVAAVPTWAINTERNR